MAGPSRDPTPTPRRAAENAWARLDLDSDVPVFLQLYRQLVAAILAGSVPADSRLPSARQLASDLAIHYHTVNKAYALLRRNGFAVLSRRKQLFARVPTAPSAAYLVDWSGRQEELLLEAMGSGLTPAAVRARFERLLRQAGNRRGARGRAAA